MVIPPLLKLKSEIDYKKHFISKYCRSPIKTFDDIKVYFKKYKFNHDFYESSKRNKIKDKFSTIRAERMDWIEYALTNKSATLYQGWSKKKNCYVNNRRVSVVIHDYVVVIELNKTMEKAKFITAYVADNSIAKIKSSPLWQKAKK